MRPLLLILFPLCLLLSCTKEDLNAPGTEVGIYTLASFKWVANICQVDPSTAVLDAAPMVANADITRYDQVAFVYHLTPAAVAKLNSQLKPGQPFAVTVDRQPVFIGVYKPGFLSSSCMESITMSYIAPNGTSIQLGLGYPPSAIRTSAVIDDPNHPKLIATFKAQGKLF
jgi:hypothetical protein